MWFHTYKHSSCYLECKLYNGRMKLCDIEVHHEYEQGADDVISVPPYIIFGDITRFLLCRVVAICYIR